MNTTISFQKWRIAEAFSRQSGSFDKDEMRNKILQYMRSTVRKYVISIWKKGETILELNCGTGLDAVYFAQQGFKVYATDNAKGMLNQVRRKVSDNHLEESITVENYSFNQISALAPKKFDHIFSNFGGLNCTNDLQNIISQFYDLLNDNGTVTLVLMPSVCPWEVVLSLKGNFKTAFRRFSKAGADSQLEGINFTTYYYSTKEVEAFFGTTFTRTHLQSLGLICPPPYLEKIPKNFPGLFSALIKMEQRISMYPVFRNWGDHFMISMQKKG